jgi:hypothetical protein
MIKESETAVEQKLPCVHTAVQLPLLIAVVKVALAIQNHSRNGFETTQSPCSEEYTQNK